MSWRDGMRNKDAEVIRVTEPTRSNLSDFEPMVINDIFQGLRLLKGEPNDGTRRRLITDDEIPYIEVLMGFRGDDFGFKHSRFYRIANESLAQELYALTQGVTCKAEVRLPYIRSFSNNCEAFLTLGDPELSAFDFLAQQRRERLRR